LACQAHSIPNLTRLKGYWEGGGGLNQFFGEGLLREKKEGIQMCVPQGKEENGEMAGKKQRAL